MKPVQTGSFQRSALAAVAMLPGAMQLARMPRLPKSIASDLVKLTTAPLAATYAGLLWLPIRATAEAMFTIEPPPDSSIHGIAKRLIKYILFKQTARVRSQSSSASVSTSWPDRAQFA